MAKPVIEQQRQRRVRDRPLDDPALALDRADRVPRAATGNLTLPLGIAALALIIFLLAPIVALVWRASGERGKFTDQTWETLRQALTLTLITSGITLCIVLVLGTPLAYLLARRRFRGAQLINTLVDLPMVLPPAVAGIALLMAFGRRGLIGAQLDRIGITVGFTAAAVVMAQTFVSVPFYIRAARAGFSRVSLDLEEAAADLGASPARVLRTITLPLARSSLAAGAVLAWARAVGEFGATIMFAGNFPGRTQTMPLAIYGRYEAGDLDTALLLAALLLAASMLVLLAVRLIGGRAGDLA
ncbi:MAG TPA: ABC transporter permease [Thermomicrobiales bacterium]|nr:ABC transporter permease [Thermomicrobiales bacterium]